jgi:hypothetical protein
MERSSQPGATDLPAATPTRRVVATLLLVLGAQLWLLIDERLVRRPAELIVIAAVIVVSLIPPVSRVPAAGLNWIRSLQGVSVAIIAILLTVGSSIYFYFAAVHQQRQFAPVYHDEFSYQIQAQMLAHGRLWMPHHPLADFFDTFYVIVEPVYCSMYFPGTAMLLTPGVWLELPHWAMPLLLSGLTVSMSYLLFRELLDGVAGLLAAIMMVGLSLLRMLSIMTLSAVPALLLGMTLLWCWLRWRRNRRSGWLVLMGISMGWLAITRPVDALCFALPAAAFFLWDLRGESWGGAIRTVSLIMATTAPFLLLQIIFNRGVTGRWLQTPFGYYTARDYPNVAFGFPEYDPSAKPVSRVPQKQEHYRKSVADVIKKHRPSEVLRQWRDRRYLWLFREGLPDTLLLFLVPVGLIAVNQRNFVAVLAMPVLFVVLYSIYTFFIVHYLIIVAPALMLLVLLAVRSIPTLVPRASSALAVMLTLLVAAISLIALPQFQPKRLDLYFRGESHARINHALAQLEHRPAVVLFRYAPTQSIEEEPVYNPDVAWPDDAPIIRAHDLGPDRNNEIYQYYAQRQPQRAFYIYDRGDDSIKFLGTARDLAQ